MPGRKTIYNHQGIPLTDIRAAVVRSWLLNTIGEAIFYLPVSGSKCRREFLEFGNFIVVEHDSLPDWVGMIDTPRIWHNGYVEVHAFDPAFLLQYRFPPLNSIMSGTPAQRAGQLLDWANGQYDTRIRMGYQAGEGVAVEETVSESIYTHLKRLSENNGHDWICSPSYDENGNLMVILDWYARAGIDTGFELTQGKNIIYGDAPLEESGELISYEEAISDPQEDGFATATYGEAAPYGLRAVRNLYSGQPDAGTLLSYATQTVQKQKTPAVSTPLTVVDTGSTFSHLRLGNVLQYKYTNVGFDISGLGAQDTVRINGLRYDEITGMCELFTGKP